MEQITQPLFLTTLTAPELKSLFRSEIENYFSENNSIKSQQSINEDVILNIHQAAKYINLSIPSIYRLHGAKAIPVSKKGNKLRFSKQALTKWMMGGREKTLKKIEKDAENTNSISQ